MFFCTSRSFTLEASSPVDVEKKSFGRLKEDVSALVSKTKPEKPKKKEKTSKKLTKSKSTEQQPQATPTFGATVIQYIFFLNA